MKGFIPMGSAEYSKYGRTIILIDNPGYSDGDAVKKCDFKELFKKH